MDDFVHWAFTIYKNGRLEWSAGRFHHSKKIQHSIIPSKRVRTQTKEVTKKQCYDNRRATRLTMGR